MKTKKNCILIGTTDFTHAGPNYKELPPKNVKLHDYVKTQDKPILERIIMSKDQLVN